MKLNELRDLCYEIAKDKGFWDAETKTPIKLMLIVTELGEACEADRKGDHENLREEIADTFIRLFDLCGHLNIDIEYEIDKKIQKNKTRPKLHGKGY